MTIKFELTPGNEQLMEALAVGLGVFAEEVAAEVYALAPIKTGRYKRTIKASSFLNGELVYGEPVRTTGYKGTNPDLMGFRFRGAKRATLRALVYSTSQKAVYAEFGTQAHEIEGRNGKLLVWRDKFGRRHAARRVAHPGARRQPHFVPGLLAARGLAASSMARGVREALR